MGMAPQGIASQGMAPPASMGMPPSSASAASSGSSQAQPNIPSAMPPSSIGGVPYTEQFVKNGNQALAGADQLADMGVAGYKIDTQKGDGFEDRIYPSGKIVRRSMGMNTAQIAQAKDDATESGKNVEDAMNAANTLNAAAKASALLDKGTATGPGAALQNKWGGSTEDAAALKGYGATMQLGTTHQYSSRGSNVALGIVGGVKPGLFPGVEANRGYLQAIAGQQSPVFDQLKARWESSNPGKTFPVQKPDISGITNPMVNVQTPTGIVTGRLSDANKLIAAYPNHKIIGRAKQPTAGQ
jgi:hypothetical protein